MSRFFRVRVSLSNSGRKGYRIRVGVRVRVSIRVQSGWYPRFGGCARRGEYACGGGVNGACK